MIIIRKSQQYWVQRYVINPSFTNFVRKIDQEIIWNLCDIRLLNPVSAHNLIIHLISFEELSYVDCQNVAQYAIKASQYNLRINPIHEPIPGHQLIFVTKCCFRSVHIWPLTSWYFIGLNAGAFPHDDQMWMDHCEICSFVTEMRVLAI